jgi:hypothetical protein
MEKLKRITAQRANLSKDSQGYFDELKPLIEGLAYVRANVVHAVPGVDHANFTFNRRSHQNDLTKDQVLSTEEIMNYASHLVIALVASLYDQDVPSVPDRPKIPDFLRDKIKFKNDTNTLTSRLR